MKPSILATSLLSVLALAAVAVAGPTRSVPQSSAADLAGRWDLSITTPQGPQSAQLTLKKDGDKFVGTISGQQGEYPIEGTLKDKAVSLTLTVQSQNGPLTISLYGTLEGDAIKGTADFAGRGQTDWSALRAPAPAPAPAVRQNGQGETKVDVTGTWNLELQTDNGTYTPVATFKQDGEKLSGTYKSQFADTTLTGTLKGNAIEFWVEVTVQDAPIKVIYSGTVEKDTMKGTVKFGDLGEATFTGKKK